MSIITSRVVKVQNVRQLSQSTFVVRIERGEIDFHPGQYITLGLPGNNVIREYSIYSGFDQSYLEVLIKRIEEGSVSKQLVQQPPGAELLCDGPFGYFTINKLKLNSDFLFIASGTGISPFHSFICSYKDLNYRLLHGVRSVDETYDKHIYAKDSYIACISGDRVGPWFSGRVTKYLQENEVRTGTLCYICGNSEMIFESFDILKKQGLPSSNLFAEVYF